ncbi:sulfatase-like hydrolase/transferase [Rudanella paleaurantiibacter]|uniref:Sulfatase-like hydrolase/transferase n=1 Tax=Rudanella paleaurantiibacter TaxID=2614655 RepID=A0A7J5TWY0_9BACT|nr:sulfatase-like hydrolase/transferase [Rudanella paleaurantiibacter]KAB7727936.1 sulfatase-like hydrolase/transferase [Rudanella paleaurantiibacter]
MRTRYLLLILFCSGCLGLTALHTPSRPKPRSPRPNILFILVDDLGFGDLSCYGAKDVQTPHIDSLIRGGMRFTSFYANSPVCSPSRAALLSGRYPERMGVPGVIRDDTTNSWGYLAPGRLLPDYLAEQGYHTALVGKWHLGLEPENHPNRRGFREFYGFLGDMMDNYVEKKRNGQNFMRHNKEVINPPGHATDVFTNAAISYLNGQVRQRQRANDPPFFLYLSYTAPHDPLQPLAADLDRVTRTRPGIDPTRAKLVALIEHLDANVGRVLAALRANGQDRNTLVVFTSDNGGWGPGKANVGGYRGVKGTMYEGGLRIAAGVRWPAGIRPRTESDRPLLLMDWMPTLLQLAGTPVPAGIQGQSFAGLITGKDTLGDRQRPLYFVRREGHDTYKGLQIHAVRQGDFKLLQPTPFAPYELYNLRNDPYERNNLADTDRGMREQLTRQLMEHIRRGGAVPWQRPAGMGR